MHTPESTRTRAQQRGQDAEAIALSWLEHHAYRLIETNYRRRVGEIDLIVRAPDEQTIVFVEVRYRHDERHGGALASVDGRKQRRLIRTANAWLQQHAHSQTPARIDVIALGQMKTANPPSHCWKGHHLQWIINAIEE